MGINQKETEVKYQEGEKMESLRLTGEPGIVKEEPNVGNQNKHRNWRA